VIPQTLHLIPELWTKLPGELQYHGEPTPWVKMTRPGQLLHSFLEGPCFDDVGKLWLVDVPYGRIFSISSRGEWHSIIGYDGEPHSLKQKKNGSFVIADHKNGLLEFDGASKFTTLASEINGQKFKGLSDLTIAPNGDIWFTDSGRTSLSDPTGRVLRYKSNGELDLVLSNVPYPNGIALSNDGKFVYCAATRANAVWRFFADYPEPTTPMVGTYIQMNGALGPDGLAIDRFGNLAVAHAQSGRAYIYHPSGDLLAVVHLPEGKWVTSLIFQNDEENTLYIIEAETGSIYRIPTVELNGKFK
jgi:gluconolactonase